MYFLIFLLLNSRFDRLPWHPAAHGLAAAVPGQRSLDSTGPSGPGRGRRWRTARLDSACWGRSPPAAAHLRRAACGLFKFWHACESETQGIKLSAKERALIMSIRREGLLPPYEPLAVHRHAICRAGCSCSTSRRRATTRCSTATAAARARRVERPRPSGMTRSRAWRLCGPSARSKL